MPKAAPRLTPATGKPDLVLTASPAVGAGLRHDLAETAEARERQRAAIREEHRQTIERNQAERATAATVEAEELPPPHEEVESLELELPDGRIVEMGRPPAGMLTYKLASILGSDIGNQMLNGIARAFLHIRKIDGREPAPINSRIDFQKAMDAMGEGGIDLVTAACQINWPPFTLADLKIVKKTLKTPP